MTAVIRARDLELNWQPTLESDTDSPTSWRDLQEAKRRHLGQGAWVDHLPGWLSGHDGLVPMLVSDVPWQHERRTMYDQVVAVPRLTAHFPQIASLPAQLLTDAGDRLTRHYSAQGWEPFGTAGLCLYRSGRDSVAWHGDRVGRGAEEDLLVAILSLGSERRLALRPRGGGSSLDYALGHGDLLVMGGSCQRTWDHCVPKSRAVSGARISVQFRPRGVA